MLKRAAAVFATVLALGAGQPAFADQAVAQPMASVSVDDGRFEVASVHVGVRGPWHLSRVFQAVAQFFAAPTPAPTAGTFLGYAQISPGSGYNNAITLPSNASLPAVAGSPWVWVGKFRVDDNFGNLPSGSSPYTLMSGSATTPGCLTNASCSGGSDRVLQITNPQASGATLNSELTLTAKRSNGSLWAKPCGAGCASTGIQLAASTSYCVVIAQYASGAMSITANDSTGAPAPGSPSVQTTANNTASPGAVNYYYAAGSGSPAAQVNLFGAIGSAFTGTTNANERGLAGPFGDVAMLYGALPNTGGTPTASVLQSLCDGSKTLAQWASDNSLTIQSHYPLNNPNASPPTSFAADPAGTITTAASVVGGDTAKIIPASPLDPLPCLTLNEKGPYDVAPIDAGQTAVGTAMVSGAISAASCGFAPNGVEAKLTDIATGVDVSGWTALTLSGSTYKGFVGSIAASPDFDHCNRVSVRLKNSPTYILAAQYPLCIGFSYVREGQSQVNRMTLPGTVNTGSNLVGNRTFVLNMMPLSDTAVGTASVSNHGQGQASLIVIDANTNPGGGSANQTAGDGIVEEAQDLAADLGMVVKVISLAKSGQASDSWACDHIPQTAALAGSGVGAYSIATLYSAASPVGCGGANATYASTDFNVTGTKISVLKGSVTIKDAGGVTVATESGGGTFTGAGVNAGGSLNYLTGAVSGLTFTGSQNSPLTASWTEISDTTSSIYTQQSPYVGYSTFGDGLTKTSGYVTQVMLDVFQPFDAYVFEQCTTDQNAISSTNPPVTNGAGYPLSWQTKWTSFFNSKMAAFPAWRANTPIMVLGYGRDSLGIRSNNAGCRQALAAMAAVGGQFSFGGTYIDVLTDCTVTLCLSPHEGPYVAGGRRAGRRAAARLCALAEGSATTCTPKVGSPYSVQEPTITGAARVGTTVTFTVTLPNGGALSNCGAALSGGLNTPSQTVNSCAPPGSPVGTAVYGMIFGTSATNMWNFDGQNQFNHTVDDTKTFTCQIASATTFTCTGGSFAAGLLWAYASDSPIGEAGTAELPSVAGTGYSGAGSNSVTGSGATNASGGTCVHATMSIHQSGGVVTATRATPGSSCVGTDTFANPGLTAGSGYAVSAVYWAPQDDHNRVGQLLYDNTGNCNGVRSATTFEPGCPVTPIPIPQGPLS